MNPKDKDKLYKLLSYLKDNGEEKALAYYKRLYKMFKESNKIDL